MRISLYRRAPIVQIRNMGACSIYFARLIGAKGTQEISFFIFSSIRLSTSVSYDGKLAEHLSLVGALVEFNLDISGIFVNVFWTTESQTIQYGPHLQVFWT